MEEVCSWGKLDVGDVWTEIMIGSDRGIVQRIIHEKKYKRNKFDEEDGSTGPGYFYKMIIKPFHGEGREEKFNSMEELYEKWPQFHPTFTKDWTQKKGHFLVGGIVGRDNFLWRQEEGKYYFDEKTFDKISASFKCSFSYGYTDLILTSEAIKHNAWKVLSYKGVQHFPQFLEDFPDVISEYGRAVWDSHTSLSAKMQGMSVFELLRFRMLR